MLDPGGSEWAKLENPWSYAGMTIGMADADDADGSSVDPADRGKGASRIPLPPRKEVYEKWWSAYRTGARSPRVLAKTLKVSVHTIRYAIKFGWPDQWMPALGQRAAEFDRQLGERIQDTAKGKEEQAIIAVAELVTDDWSQVARAYLENGRVARQVGTKLLSKLAARVETINLDDVDARALSAMLRLTVSAIKEGAAVEKALHGSLEPEGPGHGVDVPSLSQEQLEALRAGELPRDVTDEQLAAALLEAKRLAS